MELMPEFLKRLVQYLVKWFADRYFVGNDSIVPALLDIVDTPNQSGIGTCL